VVLNLAYGNLAREVWLESKLQPSVMTPKMSLPASLLESAFNLR
jgi:hypothetical protein